jgi:hypothetical protein
MELAAWAVEIGADQDPLIRDRVADIMTREWVLGCISDELTSRRLTGRSAGPGGSVVKLLTSQLLRITSAFGMELTGPGSIAWPEGDGASSRWSRNACGTIGLLAGAGTDDILRNVIAERILQMPRDRAVNADLPFADAAREQARIV